MNYEKIWKNEKKFLNIYIIFWEILLCMNIVILKNQIMNFDDDVCLTKCNWVSWWDLCKNIVMIVVIIKNETFVSIFNGKC